jgi:hypothetical protein
MSNEDRFKMFGTCDICHKEVIVQDCTRLAYDRLYCPACYENIVHERRLDSVNGGFLDGALTRRHRLTSSS